MASCVYPLTVSFSIPYVRFDGQMSQKRRAETISRFSVPIQATAPGPSQEESMPTQSRRRATRKIIMDDEDAPVKNDDNDSDFVVDDDFSDDGYVDSSSPVKPKKGKGKASKGKAKARSPSPFEFDSTDAENPRVMLISLKAVCLLSVHIFLSLISFVQGALGLNLTGMLLLGVYQATADFFTKSLTMFICKSLSL